jgi:hypothetical protein
MHQRLRVGDGVALDRPPGDGEIEAPGDAGVVGTGVGDGVGDGGSNEPRGIRVGAFVMTPTMSSEVKSTNGRTTALRVSAPGVPVTRVTVPTGISGTKKLPRDGPTVTSVCPARTAAVWLSRDNVNEFGPAPWT